MYIMLYFIISVIVIAFIWSKLPYSFGHDKYLVVINYRSGIQQKFWSYYIQIKYEDSDIKGIKYRSLNHSKLRPLRVCVDNIESIWIEKTIQGLLGERDD